MRIRALVVNPNGDLAFRFLGQKVSWTREMDSFQSFTPELNIVETNFTDTMYRREKDRLLLDQGNVITTNKRILRVVLDIGY